MATYVALYNLTEQGIRHIAEAPQRIEAGIEAWEASGGKMLGFYATMGEYDYVAIIEAATEHQAAAFSLAIGSLGNVRTTTMRGFTRDEFAEIVSRLPAIG